MHLWWTSQNLFSEEIPALCSDLYEERGLNRGTLFATSRQSKKCRVREKLQAADLSWAPGRMLWQIRINRQHLEVWIYILFSCLLSTVLVSTTLSLCTCMCVCVCVLLHHSYDQSLGCWNIHSSAFSIYPNPVICATNVEKESGGRIGLPEPNVYGSLNQRTCSAIYPSCPAGVRVRTSCIRCPVWLWTCCVAGKSWMGCPRLSMCFVANFPPRNSWPGCNNRRFPF